MVGGSEFKTLIDSLRLGGPQHQRRMCLIVDRLVKKQQQKCVLAISKVALAEVLGGSDVKTLTDRKVFTDSLRPGATTSEKNVLASGQVGKQNNNKNVFFYDTK